MWVSILKWCNHDVGGKCQNGIAGLLVAQQRRMERQAAAVRQAQAEAAAARAEAAGLRAQLRALKGWVQQWVQACR